MEKRPKQIIYISEQILISGRIPADFLNPEQFELCSIQTLSEFGILAQAKPPKAMVTTLELPEDELDRFCKQIIELRRQGKIFSLIALDTQNQNENLEKYFSLGFNAVLPSTATVDEIRLELQSLLGLQLRKFSRKQIKMQASFQINDSRYQTQATTINEECVVIELPHPSPLVEQDTLHLHLDADDLNFHENIWCTCWRMKNNCAILRFMDPDAPFITAIQALPEKDPEKSSLGTGDGSGFSVIDFDAMVQKLDKGEYPQSFAADQKEKLKNLMQSKNNQGRFYLGLVLLQQQTDHLYTLMVGWSPEQAQNAQSVFEAHKGIAKKLSDEIQGQISESVVAGNIEGMNALNTIKTDLQKPIARMQKLFDVKLLVQAPRPEGVKEIAQEIPIPAARKDYQTESIPKKSKTAAPQPGSFKQLFTMAMVLMVMVGSVWFAYSQYGKPRKRLTTLSAGQASELSTYVSRAMRYKSKEQTNLKLFLNGDWNRLDASEREQALLALREKFLQQGVDYARLYNDEGRLVTRYGKGKFLSWSGKKLK